MFFGKYMSNNAPAGGPNVLGIKGSRSRPTTNKANFCQTDFSKSVWLHCRTVAYQDARKFCIKRKQELEPSVGSSTRELGRTILPHRLRLLLRASPKRVSGVPDVA